VGKWGRIGSTHDYTCSPVRCFWLFPDTLLIHCAGNADLHVLEKWSVGWRGSGEGSVGSDRGCHISAAWCDSNWRIAVSARVCSGERPPSLELFSIVFGSVTAWDLLTWAPRRTDVGAGPIHGFALRRFPGIPALTYGWLIRTGEAELAFVYRPWLFLPSKTAVLPPGSLILEKGLTAPNILLVRGSGKAIPVVQLCGRYLTHEHEVQKLLIFDRMEDIPFLRGLRSAWMSIKELTGMGVVETG